MSSPIHLHIHALMLLVLLLQVIGTLSPLEWPIFLFSNEYYSLVRLNALIQVYQLWHLLRVYIHLRAKHAHLCCPYTQRRRHLGLSSVTISFGPSSIGLQPWLLTTYTGRVWQLEALIRKHSVPGCLENRSIDQFDWDDTSVRAECELLPILIILVYIQRFLVLIVVEWELRVIERVNKRRLVRVLRKRCCFFTGFVLMTSSCNERHQQKYIGFGTT